MLLLLAVTLFLNLLCHTQCASSTCTYYFPGPANVLFLLDTSNSVSQNDFEELKSFMKTMILKTMRIGPDPDSSMVRLGVILFNSSMAATVIDLISDPEQSSSKVYESEFFAQYGLFETRVQFTQDSIAGTSSDNPMEEAFKMAHILLENSMKNDPTRTQFIIFGSDANFDFVGNSVGAASRMSAVLDAVLDMRASFYIDAGYVCEHHAGLCNRMRVYGVGLGTHYNKTSMMAIVQEGYMPRHPGTYIIRPECSMKTLEDWEGYIAGLHTQPDEETLGAIHNFTDHALCCRLCEERTPEGADVPSSCGAREFDSSNYKTFQCYTPDNSTTSHFCGKFIENSIRNTDSPPVTTNEPILDPTENDPQGDSTIDHHQKVRVIVLSCVVPISVVVAVAVAVVLVRKWIKKKLNLSCNDEHYEELSDPYDEISDHYDEISGHYDEISTILPTPLVSPIPPPICERPRHLVDDPIMNVRSSISDSVVINDKVVQRKASQMSNGLRYGNMQRSSIPTSAREICTGSLDHVHETQLEESRLDYNVINNPKHSSTSLDNTKLKHIIDEIELATNDQILEQSSGDFDVVRSMDQQSESISQENISSISTTSKIHVEHRRNGDILSYHNGLNYGNLQTDCTSLSPTVCEPMPNLLDKRSGYEREEGMLHSRRNLQLIKRSNTTESGNDEYVENDDGIKLVDTTTNVRSSSDADINNDKAVQKNAYQMSDGLPYGNMRRSSIPTSASKRHREEDITGSLNFANEMQLDKRLGYHRLGYHREGGMLYAWNNLQPNKRSNRFDDGFDDAVQSDDGNELAGHANEDDTG